ncbi:MAG: tetratricopeptide repeat protein [bacterium]
MYAAVSRVYEFPFWILLFPLIGLGAYLTLSTRSPGALWERLAYLTGRLTLIFGVLYIPLVFYTGTWRHYNVPKDESFQFLVLIMLASWWAVKGRFVRPHSPLLIPAAYFLLIMLLAIFGAVNMAESWETLTLYGAVLIQMILLAAFLRGSSDLRLFCVVLNITTLIVVLYALGQWFDWTPIWRAIEGPNAERFTAKPVSFMGNENYTAEFLNLVFPVAISLLIYSWGHPFWMAMYSFMACLIMIAFLYIDCNASYMGFAVGFPVMALILISYRGLPAIHRIGLLTKPSGEPVSLDDLRFWFRRIVFALILGVSVLAAVLASVENPIRNRVASLITWADVDGDHQPDGVPPMIFRLECMSSAIRTTYDNIVTGIGAGNFKVIHPGYESQLERKILGKETLARKVHNDFLSHAVENGCFGMLGFVWMWVTALWCAFRSLRSLDWSGREDAIVGPKDRPHSMDNRRFLLFLQVGAIGAMLIGLVSCNFGHTFVIPSSLVLFWFIAGSSALVYSWTRGARVISQPAAMIRSLSFSSIPTFVRWPVLLVGVLVFVPGLVRQMTGESHLRTAMTLQGARLYGKMFDHFDAAMEVWPYQMETYYILGRYCIDAFTDMEQVRSTCEQQARDIEATNELTPEQRVALKENLEKTVRANLAVYGLDEEKKTAIVDLGTRVLQVDVFLNPIYKWAHNNLGVLYDKKGEFAYSKRSYDRVLEIDYEQVYAHFNHGLGFLREGNYELARKSFEAANVADPERTDMLQYIGLAYFRMNDFEHAKGALDYYMYKEWEERGVPWSPDPATRNSLYEWYSKIGIQLTATEKYAKAADALARAEKLESPDIGKEEQRFISDQLAAIYVKLGRYDDAIDVYKTMLARHDKDNTVRRFLSNILGHLGRYEESLKVMQHVTQDEPWDWKAWYSCASLKTLIPTYDNASILQDLKTAFEKNPEETSAALRADLSGETPVFSKLRADPALKEILGEEIFIQVQK